VLVAQNLEMERGAVGKAQNLKDLLVKMSATNQRD